MAISLTAHACPLFPPPLDPPDPLPFSHKRAFCKPLPQYQTSTVLNQDRVRRGKRHKDSDTVSLKMKRSLPSRGSNSREEGSRCEVIPSCRAFVKAREREGSTCLQQLGRAPQRWQPEMGAWENLHKFRSFRESHSGTATTIFLKHLLCTRPWSKHHMYDINESAQQFHRTGPTIIPILQIRKLRLILKLRSLFSIS